MKKIITFTLAIAFVFSASNVFAHTATTTSSQVNAYLNQLQILRQLQQGMSGEDVKILQAVLASQADVYPEGIISGYYGPLTSKAVQKYQEKFGIPAVGRVGPMTLGKLNHLLSFNNDTLRVATGTSTATTSATRCVKIPPGHLIAPGWLKKHGGTLPEAPACQKLPPGIVKNITNRSTTTATTTPDTDTKAPVIKSITATSTASTSVIKWTTNEPATSKVFYSTSTPISLASTTSSTVAGFTKNHVVNLNSLTATSTYYFVILSADAAGNVATSSQRSFSTLGN